MWTRPGARPMRFIAEQQMDAGRVAFRWRARFGARLLRPFVVTDAYEDGAGRLEGRLAGVRLFRSTGPDVDRGQVMRYLAELAWLPDPREPRGPVDRPRAGRGRGCGRLRRRRAAVHGSVSAPAATSSRRTHRIARGRWTAARCRRRGVASSRTTASWAVYGCRGGPRSPGSSRRAASPTGAPRSPRWRSSAPRLSGSRSRRPAGRVHHLDHVAPGVGAAAVDVGEAVDLGEPARRQRRPVPARPVRGPRPARRRPGRCRGASPRCRSAAGARGRRASAPR